MRMRPWVMGVDDIRWGTAVALDKVGVASFNGAIGGKTGGLMGIAIAPNGDVWIADGSKTNCCFSPAAGCRTDASLGSASPFGIAIE